MTYVFARKSFPVLRKYGHILLSFCWLSGLAFGVFLFCHASYFSLMPVTSLRHLSIVDLAVSSFFPFLFSAFSVYISQPVLIFPICFSKATSFSFLFCVVSSFFGSAGWLVGALLFMRAFLLMPVFIWYSMRHISGVASFKWTEIVWILLFCVFLAVIEHYFLSSFLLDLFKFWKG